MGLFGKNFADTLGLIGAGISDYENGGGTENLSAYQKNRMALAQQQQKAMAQQKLMGLFGNQAVPADPLTGKNLQPTPGGIPSISDPRVAQILLQAEQAGVDPGSLLEIMKANQPDNMVGPNGEVLNKHNAGDLGRVLENRANVNGTIVDLNDRNNTNRVISEAPVKGAMPVYDNLGRVTDWTLPTGAANVIGQASEADQTGKSMGSFQNVPVSNGATAFMLGRDYAGGGAGRTVPGGGVQLGISQSPADKVTAEGNARTGVERAANQPQAFSGLQDQSRTTDFVIDSIDKLLPSINGWTAGFGANLAGIKGLPAHDLQAALDAIRANVGFGELQKMRQNSPTGGALGAVSEQENKLLQSVYGSLEAGQSPAQLRTNLLTLRNQLDAIRQQRKGLYESTYGPAPTSGGQGSARSAPPRQDIEAELRRRGLLK